MLSAEDNKRLTEVGPGTPMGELLRRYWMPIAAIAELDDRPTKPIRLLGEDLVLYRDNAGRYGLINRKCPHRGADLVYGMLEECGLRCNYHGWLFNERGRCLAQPFEERANPEADFKERIRLRAYSVEVNAGLLWAYLGPAPAPAVPDWRNFYTKGYKHICYVHLPCNWVHVMENAFDQLHNEWMHDKWSFYLRDGSVPSDRWQMQKIIHREFDCGWAAERQYVGHSEIFPDRVILWPNYSCFGPSFEWVVPVDDTNTLLIYQHCTRFYSEAPFKQRRIPYWTGWIKAPGSDEPLARPPRNQDVLVWIGQGPVPDRTQEHLGASDTGVIMYRKKLMEQIDVVQAGGEPKGLVRDPSKYFVKLPASVPSGPQRDGLPGAITTPADMRTIGYVAGFPDEIAQELKEISQERGEHVRFVKALKEAGWKVGGKDFSRNRHFAALKAHGLNENTSPSGVKSE